MYSEKLKQNFYKQPDNTVKFDDGIIYTSHEMLRLQGMSAEVIQAVHKVKKIFEGEVVR